MAKKGQSRPDPSLAPLQWDGYSWTGQTVLPTWRGYQTRQGPYAHRSSNQPSDGTARLFVHVPGHDQRPPSEEQAGAYRYLVEQEKAVSDSILDALLDEYP